MFIELNTTDGKKIMIETDKIVAIRQGPNSRAQILLITGLEVPVIEDYATVILRVKPSEKAR